MSGAPASSAERSNLKIIQGGADSEPIEESQDLRSKVGSAAWGKRLRKRAKDLVGQLDTGFMELARLLFEAFDTPIDGNAQRGPIYQSWGYQTFGDYTEKELGIGIRKAEHLRSIWFVLEKQLADIDAALKQRIIHLGYTKVRIIVPILSARNAESWCEIAENHTCSELEKLVKDERRVQKLGEDVAAGGSVSGDEPAKAEKDNQVDEAEEPEVLTRETFSLYPEQSKNVTLALKEAKKICGSEKKSHLLDMICLDFLGNNDFNGSDKDSRARYLAKVERTLGVKLLAYDPATADIVYGYDVLEMISEGLSDDKAKVG